MDRFEQMRVLAAVVENGSFTAAAEQLSSSRAKISKCIAALEDRLGVRLLNRTTRRVNPTEIGRAYYGRCRRILLDMEEAEHSASKADHRIAGELRVIAPVNFGRSKLGAAIAELLITYPKLRIDLRLNDRSVDPIEAGYDVAIRIGNRVYRSSPNLGVCRISTSNRILCAAPEYLAARGEPRTPHDLITHECLSYSYVDEPQIWRLCKDKERFEIPVSGRIVTSSGLVLNATAVSGLGIAYGPENFFREAMRSGRLQRVLPSYELPQFAIWSTFPAGRYPSAKVTAFNKFMAKFMKSSDDIDTLGQEPAVTSGSA
jgi:DNA-binding transcriptional LysR family regulator